MTILIQHPPEILQVALFTSHLNQTDEIPGRQMLFTSCPAFCPWQRPELMDIVHFSHFSSQQAGRVAEAEKNRVAGPQKPNFHWHLKDEQYLFSYELLGVLAHFRYVELKLAVRLTGKITGREQQFVWK
uniref:Uncharacterized protein n=1 Tax=Sphaerodactylus townsendi TaxID=933632 RepID=A0ACB8EA27_9SAUR